MEGPYVRELNEERSSLTFSNQRVEDEYQAYAASRNSKSLRLQLALGASLILAMSLLDTLFLDPEFVSKALWIRGTVMLPVIGLMFALTYRAGGHRFLQPAGVLVGLAVGLGSMSIASIAASYAVPREFAGFLIIVVFIYYFLGLRAVVAVATSMTLFVVFVLAAVTHDVDPVRVSYNALYILFLNVIGAMGSLKMSRARRMVFLEERILSYRANHDALTQLPNRRAFDEYLQSTWEDARRSGASVSLLMLDIDHFKAYNDLYGHQAGDHAISEVGKILGTSLQRPQDFAGRYGGEEFVVLLFDSSRDYALQLAEKIRTALLQKNLDHRGSSAARCVTVSIGLAHLTPRTSNRSMKGLLQMADEALYAAKEQGRNCVVDASRSMHSTSTGVFQVAKISSGKQGVKHASAT